MSNIRIYVGTYKKYNEGNLFGKWLNLSDYSNYQELKEAIYTLHSDEEDPEFMFQDYECWSFIAEFGLISESYLSENIFEAVELIENCQYELSVIEAYADCIGGTSEVKELIEFVEESYSGSYDSDEEFTRTLLEECGDIPNELPCYVHIDWRSTARDIMMDYSSSNNHYFRNI